MKRVFLFIAFSFAKIQENYKNAKLMYIYEYLLTQTTERVV